MAPVATGTGDAVRAHVPREDDLAAWRDLARRLVAARIPPARVVWSGPGERADDLFAGAAPLPEPQAGPPVRASRAFLEVAESAILHREPERFAVLYRVLWRLQAERHLMDSAADPDVHRLMQMVRQVRREMHKMRAFVRFRAVEEGDGGQRYVAWFEPEHHVVRSNAAFFLGRFASQRWSILTPNVCLHWDGRELTETVGASRCDAPDEDAAEDLWQRYYAAIFNPARLKVAAMVREMPRRYWNNLPEARLIPGLIASAQAREAAMVDKGESRFDIPQPRSLKAIAQGIEACRRCPIGCNGTHAVPGAGPARADLMIVGEQPGDTEEKTGQPFTGPAGRLLDVYLEQAGLDRTRIRVTNAVKHFKFVPRGKRRLHQTPTSGEIDICRWWLDAERRLVRPRLVLALGASAGRALLGRTPSVGRERGVPMQAADGAAMWLTVHPSYLLRLDGDARERETARFRQDLQGLASHLANAPAS